MRRLTRPALERVLAGHLDRLQRMVDEGADVEALWRAERRKTLMVRIARVLASVAGARQRCMYCDDSRGTDIEHFWPRRYRDRVFLWLNLLWVCAACNRCKSHRFPCDSAGLPLLIDPTAEDPWCFLFYDSRTDEITARWDGETGQELAKGKETVAILATLRHEAVTEGRRRARLGLQRTVAAFLKDMREEIRAGAREEAAEALLANLAAQGDHGVAQWFFLHDGREEVPFSTLRQSFPELWARIVASLS